MSKRTSQEVGGLKNERTMKSPGESQVAQAKAHVSAPDTGEPLVAGASGRLERWSAVLPLALVVVGALETHPAGLAPSFSSWSRGWRFLQSHKRSRSATACGRAVVVVGAAPLARSPLDSCWVVGRLGRCTIPDDRSTRPPNA